MHAGLRAGVEGGVACGEVVDEEFEELGGSVIGYWICGAGLGAPGEDSGGLDGVVGWELVV